jgi:signal transduction histidine kinase
MHAGLDLKRHSSVITNSDSSPEEGQGQANQSTMTDTLASTPDAHNLLPLPSEDVFVYIIIEVLDDGRGITPFVASKLFRPFMHEQDLEAGQMSEAGTGLGLAIVHELAALFCGKVFVVSTPGQGSSFRFLFPARLPRRPIGAFVSCHACYCC